jgi:hypothetical protein
MKILYDFIRNYRMGPKSGPLSVADHHFGPWKELGDPSRGTEVENKTTFWSQSTYW